VVLRCAPCFMRELSPSVAHCPIFFFVRVFAGGLPYAMRGGVLSHWRPGVFFHGIDHRWLRHLLAQRLREAQRKEAAKIERRRRREESQADGKDAMVEDESESEEDLRHSTLQDRLLQAQARGGEGSRRASAGGEADGLRRADGWGGVDGVRCRLHSGDRLQGLEPCIRINLFPGGYSVEGDHTGRKYDKDSKEFLAGLDRGKIPARKLLQLSGHSNLVYIDGCLLVEVRDYRMPRNLDQMPAVWTLVLQPDSGCVAQDLSTLSESHQNLNSDDLMLVEKSMLLVTHPAVCLNPSPHVAAVATVLHRRANRMGVWHERPTRSAISQFRCLPCPNHSRSHFAPVAQTLALACQCCATYYVCARSGGEAIGLAGGGVVSGEHAHEKDVFEARFTWSMWIQWFTGHLFVD